MKITIIIAVYNGYKTLQACLNSIAGQTYLDRELIIIDGGSIDGTIDILYENTANIDYWESAPDNGIYHAWNKALKHITGEWVYFLGADDVFHDNYVLSKFASKVQCAPIFTLVAYGQIEFCKDGQRRLMGLPWEIIKSKIKRGMYIPHQGMFHHIKLFEQCGKFDERYHIAGDYCLLLKSLELSSPFFIKDFIVADMYAGGKSSDPAARWKVLKEFRSIQKEMNFPVSMDWLLAYINAHIYRVLNKIKILIRLI